MCLRVSKLAFLKSRASSWVRVDKGATDLESSAQSLTQRQVRPVS